MNSRRILVALFLLGFALRALLVALPLEESISRILTDDAYYNLQVARHVLAGEGATFDGRHPTNGFHPLWMVACFLPLQLEDPVQVTRGLLALASLVDLLGAAVLFAVLRRVAAPTFALVVTGAWLLNPVTIGLALNGLDTPLVFLLTTMAVGALISEASMERPRRRRTDSLFALAFLARVDVLILCAMLGAFRVLEWLRKRHTLGSVFATAGILAVTIVPYFAWNRIVYGLWTPASGLALSEHLVHASGLHPGEGAGAAAWLAYFGEALSKFLPEYLAFYGANLLQGPVTGASSLVVLAGLFSLAVVFAFASWTALRNRIDSRGWLPSIEIFVVLVPVAYFGAYLLRLGPKTRYILPALIAAWFVAGMASRTWSKRDLLRRLGLALLPILALNLTWGWVQLFATPDLHGWTRRANLTKGLEVLSEIPEDARIGAFNSGVYAFFSGRDVVNLDGLINNDAYFAIRDHRLVDFIVEDDIDYVLDFADQIQLYLSAFGGLPLERFGERFEIAREIPLEDPLLAAANQRLLLLRVRR
ncbi:MAG: hypothetical protein RL885_06555 [Planctomycetota bacterium]